MSIPNPISEREDKDRREREGEYKGKRKRSRECYAQTMLASLILGRRPLDGPGEKALPPSQLGGRLLHAIDVKAFGTGEWETAPVLEKEYPLKTTDSNSAKDWPDLGATWPDRLLLFELKTDPGMSSRQSFGKIPGFGKQLLLRVLAFQVLIHRLRPIIGF